MTSVIPVYGGVVPRAPRGLPAPPAIPIAYASVQGATTYTRSGISQTTISDPGDGWTLGFEPPTAANSFVLLDLGPVSAIPGALRCIDSGGRLEALVEIDVPSSGAPFVGLGLGEAEETLLPVPSFGMLAGGFLTYLEASFSGSTISVSGVEEQAYGGARPAVARFVLDAAVAGTRSREAWVQPVGDRTATGEQLDPTGATVPILPPVYAGRISLYGQGPDNGAGPGSRVASGDLHLYAYLFTQGSGAHRARVQMLPLGGPISPYSP